MVKNAVLFPGQGAQYPGMGKDFYDASSKVRELFEIASDMSKVDIRRLLFTGSADELKQTEVTQPAVTAVNIAAWYFLQENGITGDAFAGFSLGELSAFHAAGILKVEDLFLLAGIRGRLMARAARVAEEQNGELGMAAVIGLNYEKVAQLLENIGIDHLYPANDNSELQVVLSGLKKSIDQAIPMLKENGARRIIPLKVSAPFHTPLLTIARETFTEEISAVEFANPTSPVYTTVTGELIASGAEAKKFCSQQLTAPVRWTGIVQNLSGERYPMLESCYEAGPGKVLSGFWKSAGVSIACSPAGTVEAVQNFTGQKYVRDGYA
ncbi:MAG: ACP S-malonyltransferase [Spirochaetales bacterium]|jgi:[acyl-carrier-protein] S-malonyltransferase|nr:ACP S-malonyltransferase [Spirochaetales bacterium]